jgi:outer membrane cobalamin receptor
VRVYVDNASFGGVESLRNVDIANIKTIRYFDGVAATARWGIDHGGGVIPVMTHQ